MSRVADCLVAQLRKLPADDSGVLGELRRAIADELGGCSLGELQAAVQSLRFAGKLEWGRLALSPGMRPPAAASPGQAPSMRGPDDGQEAGVRGTAGPDDHDDYPGNVNDIEPGAEQSTAPASVPGADPANAPDRPPDGRSFDAPGAQQVGGHSIPDRAAGLHQRSIRSAVTIAGRKPVPPPRHETEVQRLVREEANDAGARRRQATSTGTVRNPIRMHGRGELDLAETIQSLLAEEPHDLITAVARRHARAWTRIINLGRARGRSPGVTLYDVLEAGLEALEQPQEARDAA